MYFVSGIIALGTFIDAINNSISLPPVYAFVLIAALALAWVGVEIILRVKAQEWVLKGGQKSSLKKLGVWPRLAFAGALTMLLIPKLGFVLEQGAGRGWGTDPSSNSASEQRTEDSQQALSSSQQNKIILLVANFSSTTGENYGVTELLLERLRDATSEFPDIEVKALGETITAQQGKDVAVAKGKEHQANIVLWGWFAKTNEKVLVTTHFVMLGDLVNKIDLGSESPDKRQISTAGLLELENFTLQTRLSEEMSAITLFATGLTRLTAGDDEAAITRFNKALEQNAWPEQIVDASDIYLSRGIALLNKSTTHRAETSKEAFDDFNKAILANDKNSYAYLMRAHTYLVEEKYDAAIADVTKVLGYETDVYVLANAYSLIGGLYSLNHEPERANYFYDKFIQVSEINHTNADIYDKRAQVFKARGDYDKAIQNIDKAIEFAHSDNKKGYYHYSKGLIRLNQEDFDAAVAEFDESLRADPDYIYSYYFKGNAYEGKKDYARAIENYNLALKLGPQFAHAYIDRGNVYYASGDTARALEDYATAIKSDSRMARARAFYQRAEVYRDKDLSDEALADLNQCLKLFPDYIAALKMRAYFYGLKGKNDAAISDYNRILKLTPDHSYSYHNRGNIYHVKGLFSKAVEDYDKAIELNPNNARTYLHRGLAYIAMKNKERATADLQKVLQMTDDPRLREEAQQRLKRLGVE